MTIGPEALVVDHLSVRLAGRMIFEDVGFTLARGEFCGLIGANGSGKTIAAAHHSRLHHADVR